MFLELRNKAWFEPNDEVEAFFAEVAKQNIGMVITDAAGRHDCAHMRLTHPAPSSVLWATACTGDYSRTDEWVERIKQWSEKGVQSVYFFMHQPTSCIHRNSSNILSKN